MKKDIGKCTVCAIRAELNKYEPLLVNMRQRAQVQHGTDLDDALDTSARDLAGADMEGNWLPTKQEGALKAILSFARGRLERSVVEQGVRHLRAMDLYRKEWRAMVHVWMALDGLVAKMDEVDIALERFVLADDEQRRQLKRPLNHLHPWELAPKMTELKDDLTTAERDLEYHLHQHKYLKGLQQQQEAGPSEGGNSISIDCVVCMTSLNSRWAVLLCGHQCLGLPQLCCECLEVLMRRHSIHGDGGSCPMCRRKTDWVNVHYVIAQGAHAGCAGNDGNDFDARFCDPAVPVEGNFSTKITWVTRTLRTISLRRRRDKSVVFSHWPAVLDMLSAVAMAAFSRNGLPHLCMHRAAGPLSRQSILSRFKSDPDCNILLMTLASGGRGLNLTEAQHVLLVERANCAALERQAAGRVHRTGQRRETFVHRFMIRSTVEHRLAETVDKSVSKQDNDNKTVGGSDHDSTATVDAAPQITLKQFAQLFEVERLLGD